MVGNFKHTHTHIQQEVIVGDFTYTHTHTNTGILIFYLLGIIDSQEMVMVVFNWVNSTGLRITMKKFRGHVSEGFSRLVGGKMLPKYRRQHGLGS